MLSCVSNKTKNEHIKIISTKWTANLTLNIEVFNENSTKITLCVNHLTFIQLCIYTNFFIAVKRCTWTKKIQCLVLFEFKTSNVCIDYRLENQNKPLQKQNPTANPIPSNVLFNLIKIRLMSYWKRHAQQVTNAPFIKYCAVSQCKTETSKAQ